MPDISFDTSPPAYRHWRLDTDGAIATLTLNVDPGGGLVPGYELKQNSYDLGVYIELADAVQRLRFGCPEVRAVIMTSALDRMFCAGANIGMLAQSEHAFKVNFCKFCNETLAAIEDASAGGQVYIAALNGVAAGGGYELALACEQILLTDDGSSTVALPEVPLLGVLPGTGGLTRLTDKRGVRRDLADVFATTAEGVRGQRALDWRLADELARPTGFGAAARALASRVMPPERPGAAAGGIDLPPLSRRASESGLRYEHVRVVFDPRRDGRDHDRRPGAGSGGYGGTPRRRSCRLAAGGRPRAGRRDQPAPVRRPGPRDLAAEDYRRPGRGAGHRRAARRGAAGRDGRRLAGGRDHRPVEAHAPSPGGEQPLADRADRAGQLLRRDAAGGRAGRRPPVHAGRHLRGRDRQGSSPR